MSRGGEFSVDELTIQHRDHQAILEDLDDQLLTENYHRLLEGRVADGLKDLMDWLDARRIESSDNDWMDFVRFCRLHPIRKLIHQDPFTLRAFTKPRGYAGDAELLDFIYGVDDGIGPPDGTSELGRRIFEFCTRETPACKAVRNRACLVASMVDRMAAEKMQPHLLSVAAGHLREASLSGALKQKRLGRWRAFDADIMSLGEVRRRHGQYGVETVAGTVRQILLGGIHLGEYDFIYSTGLFDYVQESVGRRLTTRCFQMLKPGGQLLIANFWMEIKGRGYMECFMDWNLTYRNHNQMMELAKGIDQKSVEDIHVTSDEGHTILFLHVTKR